MNLQNVNTKYNNKRYTFQGVSMFIHVYFHIVIELAIQKQNYTYTVSI